MVKHSERLKAMRAASAKPAPKPAAPPAKKAAVKQEYVIKCPLCSGKMTESQLRKLWHAFRASKRKTFGTGNGRPPDKSVPRCPCGKNTLKRAEARAYECCKEAGLK